MTLRDYWLNPRKYMEITRLAVPLLLSNAGLVFMQFADAMFLAKYSPDAIAASGMGGMVSWMVSSLFVGIVGYTSVITANNIGAHQEDKVGCVNWQGIYLALMAGVLTVLLGFLTAPFFRLVGHAPEIQALESEYLRVLLFGNVVFFVQASLGGYFSGRGDNVRLMAAQMSGQALNVVLDYALIFGKWGLPEMGVTGAALATVLSGLLPIAIMLAYFLRRDARERYHTHHWRLHWGIMARLLRFGVASGIQMWIDAALWTLFLVIIGRLGTVELAATSITYRLNSLAFMPIIGLARGMGTLAGQRHGAREFQEVVAYICHCLVMSEIWMISIAATYALLPEWYFRMFSADGSRGTVDFAEVLATGKTLLRFVAVYCLGDACNIALSIGLHSVGDTRWTSIMMSIVTLILVAVLLYAGYAHWGLYPIWTAATVFILALPPIWIFRLRQGNWKAIRVATD